MNSERSEIMEGPKELKQKKFSYWFAEFAIMAEGYYVSLQTTKFEREGDAQKWLAEKRELADRLGIDSRNCIEKTTLNEIHYMGRDE